MPNQSGRHPAATENAPGVRQRARAALAVLLALAGLLLLGWMLGRDIGWKRNHDSAMEHGGWAESAGDFEAARSYYNQAIEYNPFSAEAHLALGELYDKYFGDNVGAVRHYSAGLKYNPGHVRAGEAKRALDILNQIMDGVIEDPLDAAADMALAASEKFFPAFAFRLGPLPGRHADDYWRGWRQRRLGDMTWRRVTKAENGVYDAVLRFVYSDGSTMSMHFECVAGQPWKLTVGFP